MLKIKVIFFILFIFLFNGCSTKIDFKKYEMKEELLNKDKILKTKPKVSYESLELETNSNYLSKKEFENLLKYNKNFHNLFETNQEVNDAKLSIYLDSIVKTIDFIPPRRYYKKETPKQKKERQEYERYKREYELNLLMYKDFRHNPKYQKTERGYRLSRKEYELYSKTPERYKRVRNYGYYQEEYKVKIKVKVESNGSFFVKEGYANTFESIGELEYYPREMTIYKRDDLINRALGNALYKVRNRLMNPFEVTKVMKSKDKWAVLLNGGTCDGATPEKRVSIYQNNRNIGNGKVATNSTCKESWVSLEKVYEDPKIMNEVYIEE